MLQLYTMLHYMIYILCYIIWHMLQLLFSYDIIWQLQICFLKWYFATFAPINWPQGKADNDADEASTGHNEYDMYNTRWTSMPKKSWELNNTEYMDKVANYIPF